MLGMRRFGHSMNCDNSLGLHLFHQEATSLLVVRISTMIISWLDYCVLLG